MPTRKHHKTLSCHLFGVHVSLVHSLTLLLCLSVHMFAESCVPWYLPVYVRRTYVPRFYIIRYLCFHPYLCFPVPLFPGTYAPRFRCIRRTNVPPYQCPRYLCSPVPVFPGTYVRRYLRPPVPTLPVVFTSIVLISIIMFNQR